MLWKIQGMGNDGSWDETLVGNPTYFEDYEEANNTLKELAKSFDCSEDELRVTEVSSVFYARFEDSGEEELTSDNMEDAIEEACDLARSGDWGEGKCITTVYVKEVDEDTGEEINSDCETITVGEDPEPDPCVGGKEHDWKTPYHLVGGCKQNPGVWSLGGTQVTEKEVCASCGIFRNYISESTPGNYPIEPERTSYEDSTMESLEYILENTSIEYQGSYIDEDYEQEIHKFLVTFSNGAEFPVEASYEDGSLKLTTYDTFEHSDIDLLDWPEILEDLIPQK